MVSYQEQLEMRIVIQRVKEASCEVQNKICSKIGRGILIFLGIEKEDSINDAKYLAEKCVTLRIFEDSNDKMNISLKQIGGEAMVVSQFTLAANCKNGRRPSFDKALEGESARRFYNAFVNFLKEEIHVEEGVFGERMSISLKNDGPATFIIDSR